MKLRRFRNITASNYVSFDRDFDRAHEALMSELRSRMLIGKAAELGLLRMEAHK